MLGLVLNHTTFFSIPLTSSLSLSLSWFLQRHRSLLMELSPAEEGNSSASVSEVEFVHAVVKRQRSKRQRTQPSPPLPLIAGSSSASSAETVSGTVTEEDEDMANCLILLAQGRAFSEPAERSDGKITDRRVAGAGKAPGGFVYECKTCSKCFPSFQALGGHRTSHKKPKLAATMAATTVEENKRNSQVAVGNDDNLLQMGLNSSFSAKPKVHECAICGSEFSSGQALGGHMRRHRQLTAANAHLDAAKKEKSSFVSFDLNLPAPPDVTEPRNPPSPSAFISAGNRPLIFSGSASSLVVNCHY